MIRMAIYIVGIILLVNFILGIIAIPLGLSIQRPKQSRRENIQGWLLLAIAIAVVLMDRHH